MLLSTSSCNSMERQVSLQPGDLNSSTPKGLIVRYPVSNFLKRKVSFLSPLEKRYTYIILHKSHFLWKLYFFIVFLLQRNPFPFYNHSPNGKVANCSWDEIDKKLSKLLQFVSKWNIANYSLLCTSSFWRVLCRCCDGILYWFIEPLC